MYSCITIGGNEEQQKIAKNEIQRLIGHTAGVDEYKESNVTHVWNPLMQMQGILNGALDMTQLNQFMQNSGFFMNGMPIIHDGTNLAVVLFLLGKILSYGIN